MQKPNSCILAIFGASGDLAHRKLIPALFDLQLQNLLPDNFGILGIGRTPLSDESFRDKMASALDIAQLAKNATPEDKSNFLNRLFYIAIDTASVDDYQKLAARMRELNAALHTEGNYIYYLATPPSLYDTVAHNLASVGLHKCPKGQGCRRIIIEKPFGYDLNTAKELNDSIHSIYDEDQIYRIDHYLGKETVQNLLVTRFSNGIFEPLWNRNYIHHIEITSSESIGVENRGGYYDHAGALRDMVQNHLLQVASLVAMEPPAVINADSIRNETLKVLQSIRHIKKEEVSDYVIRGQYTASTIKGEHVPGYREESGVDPNSRTETFVALKFFIDNWRWSGVPFYIRTGKRLPTRVTEIVINFRQTPHALFPFTQGGHRNQLIIRIQPDEGILLKFGMKVPGAGFQAETVNMDFHYSDLSGVHLPEAYERLLLDAMLGDATLYSRGDAVEACWQFITPILEAWNEDPSIKVFGYPAGSWGPEQSEALMDGLWGWRYPCKNLSDDGLYCEL
jgi:glucose-6-phosphate 1-dehydrogenase